MVIIGGKRNSNKNKSANKSAANNTGVDKHKAWLIGGISVAILVVAMLVLFPALKGPLAGQAILTGEGGLVLKESGDDPNIYFGEFTTLGTDVYFIYLEMSNGITFNNLIINEENYGGDSFDEFISGNYLDGGRYSTISTDDICFEVKIISNDDKKVEISDECNYCYNMLVEPITYVDSICRTRITESNYISSTSLKDYSCLGVYRGVPLIKAASSTSIAYINLVGINAIVSGWANVCPIIIDDGSPQWTPSTLDEAKSCIDEYSSSASTFVELYDNTCGCNLNDLPLCQDGSSCADAEGYWYVDDEGTESCNLVCPDETSDDGNNVCVDDPVCDANNLGLCLSDGSCIEASGKWYGEASTKIKCFETCPPNTNDKDEDDICAADIIIFGDKDNNECLATDEFLPLQHYYLDVDDVDTIACPSDENDDEDCLTNDEFTSLQNNYLNEDDVNTNVCK
ncbi:hypothetical protein HON71_01005 [Candidatus Woesearchaeota archaeon]|jgi:hypothetical protein|nr:hypothetical protein [Candidatus Woesearchaeota archaeon]MBT5342974.1 hypothetical protein [Candidatus Woesearchaeota archaeon]